MYTNINVIICIMGLKFAQNYCHATAHSNPGIHSSPDLLFDADLSFR